MTYIHNEQQIECDNKNVCPKYVDTLNSEELKKECRKFGIKCTKKKETLVEHLKYKLIEMGFDPEIFRFDRTLDENRK